ncbi:hypothetical protein EMIHUDRAFT_96439 [Emiliania huxleyi CCMP1516]|uniref:prolyl aminopeptidase n=2 Tax=Emiliania huxleyi TaxID=2903 RepID=A0A0D3IU30_EMIH1|nr:hypothetical protein EMIHUDRAFT_96439 [Emiliania huxleyi CCMP1516]EOD14765.1 hypothetical protein EMIHUDRAFT_96439 [Emiliania huxleyi CCMP1516]|eukprot:XP_005767194.1 hypothetical protein EMIHUDRAFT_96439 [Emiliania huxleyi CCMP1516]
MVALSVLTMAAPTVMGMKLGPAPSPDLRYVSPPASDAANAIARPAIYPVTLFPEIAPHKEGMLDVGDGHKLYYDVSGNPDGVPAIFLHGGPGAGCSPRCRRFFDPQHYRIVILDQRGSGKSTPNAADDLEGSLVENNTPALVSDIEALRSHLGIEKRTRTAARRCCCAAPLWLAPPLPSTSGGVFLFGPDEAWEEYRRFISETSDDWARESTNLLGAVPVDAEAAPPRLRAATRQRHPPYELSISKTFIDPAVLAEYLGTPSILIPFAVHYMLHGGFLRRGQLLDGVGVMAAHGHRVAIAHGRGDYVCQPQAAWRLSEALRAAGCADVELEFVAGAGHSDSEPGLVDAMVRATERFKAVLQA